METARMLLRRFCVADVAQLFELDNDPQVMCYINGGTPTPRTVIENDQNLLRKHRVQTSDG